MSTAAPAAARVPAYRPSPALIRWRTVVGRRSASCSPRTSGVPPTLARSLRSTNIIESMISICREHAKNVKNWRDGQMALCWCAAGMVEAGKQLRGVNGHLQLPALRAELGRVTAETVIPDRQAPFHPGVQDPQEVMNEYYRTRTAA